MATRKPISRSGRFQTGPSEEVRAYSESVSFDWRLYRQDIAGSIAHASMLAKVGILTRRERDQIIEGLKQIETEITEGRFTWEPDLEDVHMNIEAALTTRVPAAAKLHTARSRNDQVATDMRLWVRDEIRLVQTRIRGLQRALISLAERTRMHLPHSELRFLPIPGYTHLQRAQPILAAHHLLAYVEMLERDFDRFVDCSQRANVSPLGAGAIAGTTLPINRSFTAKALGFHSVSNNSIDAVSDRDFIAEFLFSAALSGIHLSRLAEDLVIWSTVEFGYITINDTHTTGSSLMPQKKNPDIAELGRGKSGRLLGNLMSALATLKGLPMTYNRDLQEDKEPLFDSADTLTSTLSVFAGMIDATNFNQEKCLTAVSDPTLLSTDLADHLVRKGVPFREAHHVVGEAVKLAEQKGRKLDELQPSEWHHIHPLFGAEVTKCLNVHEALCARDNLPGSPGQKQVEKQLAFWKKKLR